MKKSRQFYDIFDECLDHMAKGEDIEACLKDYPQYAVELKPLLETALRVKRSAAVTPRPEFVIQAKSQFQTAVRQANMRPRHRFFIWQPVWATAMSVFLTVLIAGSVTVAAAGNSMPDEPLYPVKLATEQVRLVLTPSPVAKAELSAELADKRVAEIIHLAKKDEPDKMEIAMNRLQQDLERIASISQAKNQVTMKSATAPAAESEQRPRPVPAPAPALKAPPESGKALTVPPTTPSPAPTPKPAPPKISAASKDESDVKVKPQDEKERLKQAIIRNAEKHSEELREALKKAQKESVKSVLRKAIAISEDGYKQARKSLD